MGDAALLREAIALLRESSKPLFGSAPLEVRAKVAAFLLRDDVLAASVLEHAPPDRAPANDADAWEPVAWQDLRAGDEISHNVFCMRSGWDRETRDVVAVDGTTIRLRDGEREYDWVPLDDRHCEPHATTPVRRQLKRRARGTGAPVPAPQALRCQQLPPCRCVDESDCYERLFPAPLGVGGDEEAAQGAASCAPDGAANRG